MRAWLRAGIFVTVGIVTLLSLMWLIPNDLADLKWLRSATEIQKKLDADLPYGTPRSKVEVYFESMDTRVLASSDTLGLITQDGLVVGQQHLDVILCIYRFPITRVYVVAEVAFDEYGRLVLVEVTKTRDSL